MTIRSVTTGQTISIDGLVAIQGTTSSTGALSGISIPSAQRPDTHSRRVHTWLDALSRRGHDQWLRSASINSLLFIDDRPAAPAREPARATRPCSTPRTRATGRRGVRRPRVRTPPLRWRSALTSPWSCPRRGSLLVKLFVLDGRSRCAGAWHETPPSVEALLPADAIEKHPRSGRRAPGFAHDRSIVNLRGARSTDVGRARLVMMGHCPWATRPGHSPQTARRSGPRGLGASRPSPMP